MTDWRTNLPAVKGRYQENALLSEQTWFRVGGPAELLFRPQTAEDLVLFLRDKPGNVPVTLLGAGSNILVRDNGISGVVVRLGRGFAGIKIEGNKVIIGAAALDRTVALTLADAGLSGLEFLVGIPGTLGGAVKMNAGCYGQEIKDVLVWAEVMDHQGRVTRLSQTDLGFTYRHSTLEADQIVIAACFELDCGAPAEIHQRLTQLLATREQSQPVKGRTGGSTFKNPLPQKAWELIDQAGCRGLQIGDAQVSEKHCNFLLNLGNAMAKDLEELGEQVRRRVQAICGVELEWEVIRLGR
ncbi:UDP-N-acetylmuramate dehydrogenase [Candidatus Paracaedibacter symbiosus]|uniref:UDP-N-acetylmuramate dehydrogenase n=1 Tax=Candidatus Paracaedibacter symbiosus TaxID=244582 RepID=UPI000509D461|nr:UDP-N-acetylmuramate dehydrogenase [Candidatus Paracaedibacter symbiosus]